MGEIFVIISGEHENWEIKGFTDSEDKAIKICAYQNKDSSYDNDWYYKKVENIEPPHGKIEIQYIYRFHAHVEPNGGEEKLMLDNYLQGSFYFRAKGDYRTLDDVVVNWGYAGHVSILVPVWERNLEKAQKIAQDIIEKYNKGQK